MPDRALPCPTCGASKNRACMSLDGLSLPLETDHAPRIDQWWVDLCRHDRGMAQEIATVAAYTRTHVPTRDDLADAGLLGAEPEWSDDL